MKRPRSYGEDPDEDVSSDKGSVFKDWARRDSDSDRHRRFYPKGETGGSGVGRKGSSSSSYDRSLDDDRDPPPRRKRFDYNDSDVFDRRKGGGGFDRYRDGGGDRSGQVLSPRIGYGGDRIHRSESFSFSRREFPKGFRSERDRPRREGSGGPSWRRSAGGKEGNEEEVRSAVVDSAAPAVSGRGSRVASEDRGKTRSKDSSGEERRRSVEVKKPEEVRRESFSSSEMEEGELEPDLEPEPEPETEPTPETKSVPGSEDSRETETECRNGSEESFGEGRKSSSGEKLGFEEDDACDKKVDEVAVGVDMVKGTEEVPRHLSDAVGQPEEKAGIEEDKQVEKPVEDDKNEENIETDDKYDRPLCLSSVVNEVGSLGEQGSAIDEGKGVPVSASPPSQEKMEEKQKVGRGIDLELEAEAEVEQKEERHIDLEIKLKEGKSIDLEVEAEGSIALFASSKEFVLENNSGEVPINHTADMLKENGRDKGKSLAVSLSNDATSMDEEDAVEGPSSRGFELVFRSDIARSGNKYCGGIVIGKQKEEKPSLEPLALSLCLPGVSLEHTSQDPNPRSSSPAHARSIQSFPSSFRTNSDGFTASISFSGSQFVHNPSCSLTQNSMENYEHSVGSRPIFQGVDQVSNNTIWQGQLSNESKHKGGVVPFYQRALLNSKGSHHSSQVMNGQHQPKPDDLSQQSSLPRQLSPTHSHGSRETRSELNKDKKVLKRERSSSSSLFKSEQREGEKIVLHGASVVDKIVTKIVSESVQIIGSYIQEMTEQSVKYLKETIAEMVAKSDKNSQLCTLQGALQKRTDLTLETLSKCHRPLLEILVALKTGLPEFLQRTNNVPSSDLADIFLNLKCRNLACRSILPVDDCDCKVCAQKTGFCSACMCLVCSKFDLASNTCSWVGCDVCLHWCHTDCALRDSYIRNGRSATGAQGTTEVQFHCVACDHPSEMFGFVKEVFKTCAKDWNSQTLSKELEYVRRIFSASDDSRGKRLRDVAHQLLIKLENKGNLPEVINYVMAFLADTKLNFSNGPSIVASKELPRKNTEGSNGAVGSSKEGLWLSSVAVEKSPHLDNASAIISVLDSDRISRQTVDVEIQRSLEKKPAVDELDSVVRFKQAEAKMYQARADEARREAEGLKRIAIAKSEKIEEEYASRIAKLRLGEAEEKRRHKLEELQALERGHREYLSMKMRMEADIKGLLLKMEATKLNLNT